MPVIAFWKIVGLEVTPRMPSSSHVREAPASVWSRVTGCRSTGFGHPRCRADGEASSIFLLVFVSLSEQGPGVVGHVFGGEAEVGQYLSARAGGAKVV